MELIYGIHAVGSVDSGKADIIDIVTAFERTFHIDLGDVYHTFIAMRKEASTISNLIIICPYTFVKPSSDIIFSDTSLSNSFLSGVSMSISSLNNVLQV